MADQAMTSDGALGATSPSEEEGAAAAGAEMVDGGNYEVIRARLLEQGRQLRQRTEGLNDKRKEVFGGAELEVVASARVRTDNNCVPRDIVSVGELLLFGYNVFLGLKSETKTGDVFSLTQFRQTDGSYEFHPVSLEDAGSFLLDERWVDDFQKLYRYTRDAQLLGLAKTDTRLLAIFQIGETHERFKVFRWRIEADGGIAYVDDRGQDDFVFPPSHDFEWTECTRDNLVSGRYPHMNILDEIFVETTGGDLTVKVEDNTETGAGIYAEPVEEENQILDDAEFHYAQHGALILLKIKPFREEHYRYLVYNGRTQSVQRIDAVGVACQQLPEDHGIVFPQGYYLQTGQYKLFEGDTRELEFKRVVRSPNGEDVLYVFHRRRDGHYMLLPYNLIRKEVQTPIHCHGYTVFPDGRMAVFRATSEEPTRVHPMQVWQTPFTSAEFAAAAPTDGSFLAKVGNAELVRGISDAFSVARLITDSEPSRAAFEDLIGQNSRVMDSYYWLDHEDVGDLKGVLEQIRETAELIVDEFEKVEAFKARAAEQLAEAEQRVQTAARDLRPEHWTKIDPYLEALTALRALRGHLIGLREVRTMDLGRLAELEKEAEQTFDGITQACASFLLRESALQPLVQDLDAILEQLERVEKVTEADPLREKVTITAEGLELLSEVVATLQIEDTTQRTQILEGISEVFSHVNRVRATVEARRSELLGAEGRAEFAAQFKLLGQNVSSALGMADSPERCDEQLSRIMVQLEELESKFSEFDEFLADLAVKREEIYDAFSAKKQTLLDERQRRVSNLEGAADRILEGVTRRARAFKSAEELNAYFVADAMIMKLRQLGEQLTELGDTVKAEGLLGRLKTAQQNALRGLRDKLELFEEGAQLIKFGRHRFSVNTQALELTMVPRGDAMVLHLTGTDFYEELDDTEFAKTRRFWSQTVVSESDEVYRAEYLAARMLFDAEVGREGLSVAKLRDATHSESGVSELVRDYAQARYDEGYERGVHDADAALLLDKLSGLRDSAGLLRFAPLPRAMAVLFWAWCADAEAKSRWQLRARNFGRLRVAFQQTGALAALATELGERIAQFVGAERLLAAADDEGAGAEGPAAVDPFTHEDAELAGRYLVEELTAEVPRFVLSGEAHKVRDDLLVHLDRQGSRQAFTADLEALQDRLRDRFALSRAWVDGFIESDPERQPLAFLAVETAALLCDRGLDREVSSALTSVEVKNLLGQHPRIHSRALTLRIDEFLSRLGAFVHQHVPAYHRYRTLRSELVARERQRLRLDEFMPRVMTAFVRNQLINQVYLPMIGDNLAKQIGAAGESKRTDLMGLLLLISPPGYGKTTLMEYIANRLGLVFVKINGPALGHNVTSLDPREAPNATAQQEVDKINLALEMGNNAMLYLDDIQHTNPELLQKFISLCDAQRRIEGVWKGRTRTYDLRGKKFCVVMAGNPYTESGDKFQIPDMLANRADTYNLGDILEGKDQQFALSYIENAITSSPVLAPLATREQSDIYKLIRMAQGEEVPTTDLAHGYATVELNEIKGVLRHLFSCQQVLLKVNQQYIESASQDERFRTEPPFKLQGSYRNMNRMAEKVVAAMNGQEAQQLIDDHYVGEAQTLTTGAEQNLLKLAEMRGTSSEEQQARWTDIKREFVRIKRMGGGDDDPVTRVTGTLSGLGAQLDGIKDALEGSASRGLNEPLAELAKHLESIRLAVHRAAQQSHKQAQASMEQVKALQQGAPAGQAAGGAGGADLDWLRPELTKLATAMEALGHPSFDVQVQNRPPAGVEELLQQQVILIERTLVPVVKAATENLGDSRALGQHLSEILGLLREVDGRLRKGLPPA